MLRLACSRRCLLLVLSAAFILRLTGALGLQARLDQQGGRLCLIDGDADGYWRLAQNLANGKEFAIYQPPRYVLRMPGFPLVLAAGMRLSGESPRMARVLLAGVGTVACGLVFLLGRELFDAETGLVACLFATFHPTMTLFSVMLLSETLFAACALASLWLFATLKRGAEAGVSERNGCWQATVAGVLFGVATLVRPTWLVMGPLFVAIDLWRHRFRRQTLVQSGALLAGLAVTLLPWTVRNWNVTGRLVPTTLWVGPSLYDGLNARATGASDMAFVEADGLYEKLSEYDADREYRRRAWEFVQNNPRRALELTAIKFWRYWSPVPNAEQFGHWLIRWGVAAVYVPLLILAAIGSWQARRRFWPWMIPAAPIVCFAAVHAVFVGSLRYRLPVEYPLLVLSAAGVRFLMSRVGRVV